MKNVHIISSDTDRKVAKVGSVAFMIAAWLFLAALWAWVVIRAWLASEIRFWGFGAYLMLTVYLFVLIMIPVQIARYFRDKRGPK